MVAALVRGDELAADGGEGGLLGLPPPLAQRGEGLHPRGGRGGAVDLHAGREDQLPTTGLREGGEGGE